MKVIAISNLTDERVSDELIASGLTEEEAVRMAQKLNKKISDDYSYIVRSDDYELYTYEP